MNRSDPLHGIVRDAAEGILGCHAVTVTPSSDAPSRYLVDVAGVTHEVHIMPDFMAETFAGRRYWSLREAMGPLLQSLTPGRIVLARDDCRY